MASTRSLSEMLYRRLRSRQVFIALAWDTTTPLGSPVEPEV